jgi:hypothetical protein
MITDLRTIHATIITEIIITHTGIHPDLTPPDEARVTFLNQLTATAMYQEERAPHVLLPGAQYETATHQSEQTTVLSAVKADATATV